MGLNWCPFLSAKKEEAKYSYSLIMITRNEFSDDIDVETNYF